MGIGGFKKNCAPSLLSAQGGHDHREKMQVDQVNKAWQMSHDSILLVATSFENGRGRLKNWGRPGQKTDRERK